MKFHIVFNRVTWYSRMLSIIFFLGVFPCLVFYIGKKYQEYVDLLNGPTFMSLNMYGGSYSKTSGSRDFVQSVFEKKIMGRWRSEDDSRVVLLFRDLNRFFEYYDGNINNSGTWILGQSLKNTKYSEMRDGVYLFERSVMNQHSGGEDAKYLANKPSDDDYIYRISFSSDYQTLNLTYLDSNKTTVFTREGDVSLGELQKVYSR